MKRDKVIDVNRLESGLLCNVCVSDKDVVSITLGVVNQTQSIRLCKRCREELVNKIQLIDILV